MESSDHSVQAIYRGHHHWLRQWLLRQLHCSETAADLAQDTFVRLLLRGRQGEEVREPRAYLTRIARGLVVNHWQRRDVERAYLEALALLPEPQAPSPEQREAIVETLLAIDSALNTLAEPVKQAFMMAQLDGLKYRDIARRLQVAEVTVKRYVKKGLTACLLVMDSAGEQGES